MALGSVSHGMVLSGRCAVIRHRIFAAHSSVRRPARANRANGLGGMYWSSSNQDDGEKEVGEESAHNSNFAPIYLAGRLAVAHSPSAATLKGAGSR